jgi:hypothetical protein
MYRDLQPHTTPAPVQPFDFTPVFIGSFGNDFEHDTDGPYVVASRCIGADYAQLSRQERPKVGRLPLGAKF